MKTLQEVLVRLDYLSDSECSKMKKFIFTSGKRWFISYYNTLEEAQKDTPDGYTVAPYITTRQIP